MFSLVIGTEERLHDEHSAHWDRSSVALSGAGWLPGRALFFGAVCTNVQFPAGLATDRAPHRNGEYPEHKFDPWRSMGNHHRQAIPIWRHGDVGERRDSQCEGSGRRDHLLYYE